MLSKFWIDKNVFVKLKSGRYYTGIIKEINEADDISFIVIVDKFNKRVIVVSSEIEVIEEETAEEFEYRKNKFKDLKGGEENVKMA